MKVINVNVYSNKKYRQCAAGGVSERFEELLIPHERGPFDANGDEENLCKVVHRKLFGGDVYHIQPINGIDGNFTFGGSYAGSSDARFSELVGGQYGAIAVHDRKEW